MPWNKLRCMSQQLRGCITIDQVGENDNQRTSLAVDVKKVECSLVARLDHLRLEAVEIFHKPVYLIVPATRRKIAHDPSRERNHPDVISTSSCHICNRERRVYSVIKFSQVAYSRGHQSAGIQK